MSKIVSVFELVEHIERSQTPEELVTELARVAAQFGFTFTAIAAFPHPGIPFDKRVLVHQLPEGWLERYLDQDYVQVDPVLLHSQASLRPFEWSEARYERKSRSDLMMNEAAEFGCRAGYCVPTFTPLGPVNVTFGGERVEMSSDDKRLLHFIAVMAQVRATELLSGKLKSVAELLKLSPREREILRWCAEDKTSEAIADALGISTHTVLSHIGNACRKLGTRSRTAAVAKAINAGLFRLAP